MIKIVSGFTGAGGSTVVFNTLVNLFNSNGMDSCLYGNYKWDGITCRFKDIKDFYSDPGEVVVFHFLPFRDRFAKKQILSCHETTLFQLDKVNKMGGKPMVCDNIHFVSQYQKDWQAYEGVVIPNPIKQFSARTNDGSKRVAGIIGSIDSNKRVHLSIQRALDDGFSDIRLYGAVTDYPYFLSNVMNLLSDKVTYRGVAPNMDNVYNQLTHVYHSPKQETFNLIKPECIAAGVTYVGNEGNDTKAEYWTNDRILEAWKKLLSS